MRLRLWTIGAMVVGIGAVVYGGEGFGLVPRCVAVESAVMTGGGCHREWPRGMEGRLSAIRRRPYDVLRYELFVDWVWMLSQEGTRPEDRVFRGVNRITVRIDSPEVRQLSFDAAAMVVDSVTVNGMSVEASQPQGDSIIVWLPFAASAGDTLTVQIAYTSGTTRNLGLYLYPKGAFVGVGPGGDSVFVEERIAYTMSEPEDARYWMPCNDAPHDKAIAEITVAVPEGFIVASNGWLDTVITVPGTLPGVERVLLYRWRDTVPIATYLMVIHASRYAHFRDEYRRSDGSRVPLWYYVWARDVESPDTTGRRYNARYAFRDVPEMMRAYESFFGPYPFVKYGMAAVQPFAYGGMEHQTMTTVNRSWLRGWAELGIAHELAHHWLGDLVSCATWKDIWLNEGGATWSEALWLEWRRGIGAYQERMEQARSEYLRQYPRVMQLPLYAPPRELIFFYATTYAKAAWVYHMMRRMVGDSLFFPALRAYFQHYRYGAAETEDLLSVLQREIPNPPVSWRTFFDQWVYSAGHPIVEIYPTVSSLGDGRYWVRCLVRQVQTGDMVPEVFVMPWKLRFRNLSGNGAEWEFVSTEREQVVEGMLSFLPTSVELNREDVLCEYSVFPVSVALEGLGDVGLRILPEPASGGAVVEFEVVREGEVEIEVVTLTGACVKVHRSFMVKGIYRLPLSLERLGAAAGVYGVRLKVDGRVVAAKVFQWKP